MYIFYYNVIQKTHVKYAFIPFSSYLPHNKCAVIIYFLILRLSNTMDFKEFCIIQLQKKSYSNKL